MRKSAAVSMERDLYDRSTERARGLGMSTWSAYVVQLIRADLAARGCLTLNEDTTSNHPLPQAPVRYSEPHPKPHPKPRRTP
jgi:hypothetical protein